MISISIRNQQQQQQWLYKKATTIWCSEFNKIFSFDCVFRFCCVCHARLAVRTSLRTQLNEKVNTKREKMPFLIASVSLLNGNYFNNNSNCILNMKERERDGRAAHRIRSGQRIYYPNSQNNYCGNCFNNRCDSTRFSLRSCNWVNRAAKCQKVEIIAAHKRLYLNDVAH